MKVNLGTCLNIIRTDLTINVLIHNMSGWSTFKQEVIWSKSKVLKGFSQSSENKEQKLKRWTTRNYGWLALEI